MVNYFCHCGQDHGEQPCHGSHNFRHERHDDVDRHYRAGYAQVRISGPEFVVFAPSSAVKTPGKFERCRYMILRFDGRCEGEK